MNGEPNIPENINQVPPASTASDAVAIAEVFEPSCGNEDEFIALALAAYRRAHGELLPEQKHYIASRASASWLDMQAGNGETAPG